MLKYDFLFIAPIFRAVIIFWTFFKKLNLILLESHGRVEYYNGNILENKIIKVEKKKIKNKD